MKDNFDLRAYLTENKMTENSRGDVRHHLGETKLDTRLFRVGKKLLNESNENVSNTDDYLQQLADAYGDPEASKNLYFITAYEKLKSAGYLTGNPEEDLDRIEDYENDGYGWDAGYPNGWQDLDADDIDSYNSVGDQRPEKIKQDQKPVDECGDNMILGRDGNFGLEEAGYDLSDDDDDELGGVPDLADIIGSDPSAKKAAKAAQRDIDRDTKAAEKDDAAAAAADAPAGPEDSADDPGSIPDAPAAEPAGYEPGISAKLQYNPELIQFEMSPEELDQYLGSFRRPEAALRYLNQKLKVFQQEVNDGTRQKAYMYLRNGDSSYQWSYTRPTMDQGEVIATIYKDPNYKGWED